MTSFDFETTIGGKLFALVGTVAADEGRDLPSLDVTEVYDLSTGCQDMMSDTERDAFVAQNRGAIVESLWDHWCSEREKIDERRQNG